MKRSAYDSGVSSVVGTLLVLVALTTLLALMQATIVPGMNRDAERAHAEKVLDEFFTLQEKADEAGASGVARTSKITAGTLYPQVPFLYNPIQGTSGSVDLRQGQRVFARYAANSTAPFSTVVPFVPGSFPITEAGLASVSTFTMTLTNINAAGPPEITVTASGGYASTWDFDRSGDDLVINWGVNGGGCPDPQTVVDYFDAPTPINILACETGLASFTGNVGLTFARTPPGPTTGSYTLAGTRNLGPQNSTPVNATAAFLNLSPNYNYWLPPGSLLRYEHGAVVRVANGVPFLDSPSAMLGATHNATGNTTTISVYVPRLNATNTSYGQREPFSVRLTPGTLSRSQVTAYNLTLEVDTLRPSLWTGYFNSTMGGSGLPAPGNWSTASGPGWARLDIERGSPPRLNLTVSTATVEAAL